MPTTPVASTASTTPSQNEPVAVTSVAARYAPTMYSDPCARFSTSMMPKTSVRPAAIRNSISPNCRPLSNCSKTRVLVIVEPPAPFVRGGLPSDSRRVARRSFHRALARERVLVRREHLVQRAVRDAALGVPADRAQVVVLDRELVRPEAEVAAHRLEAGL